MSCAVRGTPSVLSPVWVSGVRPLLSVLFESVGVSVRFGGISRGFLA